ncbi:MAG: PAS domain-containing sensor histidine kinase [Rhizobacter sp.]|nr:PAS domain-containing sensor histidine kinase [Bacteriovorax sp.]
MYGLLVDAVNDYAIFALDPDGYILSWNSGAHRLKGYTPAEVIGTHFSRFYTKADMDRNHPAYELEMALKNGSYEEEGWRVTKTGTQFWANVAITTLRDAAGVHRGFAKVTRDLTERKMAEDKLKEANLNLEEKVKERTAELAAAKEEAENAVAARDEFLSIASHELKTPLTSLKLQVQSRKRQLEKGNLKNFSAENFLKIVEQDDKQINRINRLVDDMLEITNIASGKLSLEVEHTDLGNLVKDVLFRFTTQFEVSQIKVTSDIAENVTGIWDRYRIEQVFTNLITNALKYGNKQPIEVTVKKDNNQASLIVRDHGIGIKSIDHERVFQQFERAVSASSISGLGLGLYICRKIIESHKGKIYVESELGQGSAFIVELPLN